MRESILICTSQYSFDGQWRHEITIGFQDKTFKSAEEVLNKWTGILADPGFREHLIELGYDPITFQESVTNCQKEYLDDAGFHDFIRPLPPQA